MGKVQVPYFSDSAIHLAHVCALETWQGYSYATGKKFEESISIPNSTTETSSSNIVVLSDEYFMGRLTTQLFSIIKPREFKNNFPINDIFLNGFRKVAGIKQTERRGPKPSYVDGLAYLKRQIANEYRQYHQLIDIDRKRLEAITYARNLSLAFTQQTLPNVQINAHVMLATRLLFFIMPNCLIFNYSPEIAKGLKLSGNAEKDISEYQHKLWTGLNLNWAILCKYEMPLPKHLHSYVYDNAKKSGWWQRRILDLALKLHYTKGNGLKISERVKASLFTKPHTIV
jgi:hypothetical protein